MKRYAALILFALLCLCLLSGCGCEHEWADATCLAPQTCILCGETEGEPADHIWAAPTCEASETCNLCGGTRGEALGHSWQDATCETPKMCVSCEKAEGEALGHSWTDWSAVETTMHRACETCKTEETTAMADYLLERLQGRWNSAADLEGFGHSATDAYHGKAPVLDIAEDGSIRLFTPDGVFSSCTMACSPETLIDYEGREFCHFSLTPENAKQPFNFWYDPAHDMMFGYLAFWYERDTPEQAAVREMLLGKWTFDSVDLYDDTNADIDCSAYTVEFFEDGTFTAKLETQIEGTWLYYPGKELKLDGKTLYGVSVIYDGLWQNCNVVLEVQDDLSSMRLRFDRLRIERDYFVKE